MRVLPLGGLGEIGKNMTLVEHDGRIVVVDAGVRFPTPEMHGIDLVLPDFSYLRARADALEAVVITHGHEDHLGALPWIVRELGAASVPVVYARPLPAAMARAKLDEHKLREVAVTRLEPGEVVEAGPFSIELIHMTHSIPDAAGVLLGTALGSVLLTGDYRFDTTPVDERPPDLARLARIGEEGLLLLGGDSTNADRAGFAPSESDIGPALQTVFAGCEGRIVVTTFASNIHRIQQVLDAAHALGRKVALVGRSLLRNARIGRELGHVRAPEGVLVDARSLDRLPDEQVVIICTGSQGEPLSALRRMAYGEHRELELRDGDTIVFSATPIPGNERAVEETIDRIYRLGGRVVTARDQPIHTSGHGHREEIKLMLSLTRPRYVLPMHGDHKRLRLHAELAEAVGVAPERIFVAENGVPLDIGADGARLAEREQAGMVLVDGIELGEETESALRDRSALSRDGALFVVATVAEQDGETLAPHEIVLRGVPLPDGDEESFVQSVREEIEASLDRAADRDVHEIAELQQILHDDIAKLVHRRIRRRPMIVPVVVEV